MERAISCMNDGDVNFFNFDGSEKVKGTFAHAHSGKEELVLVISPFPLKPLYCILLCFAGFTSFQKQMFRSGWVGEQNWGGGMEKLHCVGVAPLTKPCCFSPFHLKKERNMGLQKSLNISDATCNIA